MVYLSISNTIYFKNREKEQMQRIKAVFRAVIYYAWQLKRSGKNCWVCSIMLSNASTNDAMLAKCLKCPYGPFKVRRPTDMEKSDS